MRVVTWNLQHGVPDPKGPPDLARGLEPLWALAADIYALQELDRGRCRTRFAHQAAVIADHLGGALLWAPAKHRLWAAQGNALVVRGRIVESDVVRLPGGGERRVAALALVVVRGKRWSVATAHLSLDHAIAQRQLRATLDALADHPEPRVLMGDLNLVPALVEPMTSAAGFKLVDGPFTINARKTPNRRLDHVLLRGAVTTEAGVTKMPVSDHLAVWADLA